MWAQRWRERCLLYALAVHLSGCSHPAAPVEKWVHNLTLHGQGKLSTGDLRKHLALQATGWWPFATRHEFSEAALRADGKRVVAYCQEHGYFDARVVDEHVKPYDKDGVDVTLTFEAGLPTKVVQVDLSGLSALGEPEQRHLRNQIEPPVGSIFDYADFTSTQGRLRDQLRRLGYAYAEVHGHATVDREKHEARLLYEVTLGPKVTLGAIHVTGNDGLPVGPIRRRLTFESGDIFSPHELDLSESRLYGLGVFSAVAIKLPAVPQPVADVTVQVEPAKQLHELRLGGGVGVEQQRDEFRLRLEWASHDFLGGMRTLRLSAKPAYVLVPGFTNSRRQGFAVDVLAQLVQPDLLGSAITAQVNVGYQVEIQEGYDYQGPRAVVGVERPVWRDRLLLSAAWNLQYFTFFSIDTTAFNPVTTPLGFGFQNPYRLAYIEASAELDLRDDRLNPHEGVWLATHFEVGLPQLGGDFTYTKVVPEARVYVPLGDFVTLAGRALLGGVFPSSRTHDSPITRRFFMGGPSAQRGFSYGRLSPQAVDLTTGNRVPVGGDGEVLFSAELRLGTFHLWGNPLAFVPFIDAGDVVPEVSQLHLSDLHIAVGPDLLYQTPVGPLRAGLGIPPEPVERGRPRWTAQSRPRPAIGISHHHW